MHGRRVALFLPDLRGGGAERVALALAEALLGEGCRVDLLVVRREGELLPLVPAGVTVTELGGGRLITSLLPLASYLRRERPEALHAFMWPLTVIAVIAVTMARGSTRLVLSDHTTLSAHAGDARERRAMRLTIRFFYPAADARVHVSEAAADDLARLGRIDRGSITVISNPVSVPSAVETSPQVEQLWAVPRGERILSVGSLKPTKDHALLIRAFARLRSPSARLMIVGDGAMRPHLELLAKSLGLAERVVMPGFVLDPWPFYASADLFVLASRLEGQPLVLAEAMLAGLPVVSTDCPHGPREMLDGGGYGRLVPVGDEHGLAAAMEAALAAPADADRQRRRSAELSRGDSMRQHLRILLG